MKVEKTLWYKNESEQSKNKYFDQTKNLDSIIYNEPYFSGKENPMNYYPPLRKFFFQYPSDSKLYIEGYVIMLTNLCSSLKNISNNNYAAKIINSEIKHEADSNTIIINLQIEENLFKLKDYISQNTLKLSQIINWMKQSVIFFNNANQNDFAYFDLKIEDFCIDNKGELKFVGYDFPKINWDTGKICYNNYPFYLAPELLLQEAKPSEMIKEIKETFPYYAISNHDDRVKCQIYSYGITFLFLIQDQSRVNQNDSFDQLKLIPEDYLKVLKEIDYIRKDILYDTKDKNLLANIKLIILNAIDYYPENRLNFKNLYNLLLKVTLDTKSFEAEICRIKNIEGLSLLEKGNQGNIKKDNLSEPAFDISKIPKITVSEILEFKSDEFPIECIKSVPNQFNEKEDKPLCDPEFHYLKLDKPKTEEINSFSNQEIEKTQLIQKNLLLNKSPFPHISFHGVENDYTNSATESTKTETISISNLEYEKKTIAEKIESKDIIDNSLKGNANNMNESIFDQMVPQKKRPTEYLTKELMQQNSYLKSAVIGKQTNINIKSIKKLFKCNKKCIAKNILEDDIESDEFSDDNDATIEKSATMNKSKSRPEELLEDEYLNFDIQTKIFKPFNKDEPFDINFPDFLMRIKDLYLIKKTLNHETQINSIIINKYDYSSNNYLSKNLMLKREEFGVIIYLINLSIGLIQLSIDGIKIGNENEEFLKASNKFKNLKILNLMSCDINGSTIIKILNKICLSSLEVLDIGNNSLEPENFWEITRILNIKHKKLTSLFIQGNQIEEEGALKWEENFLKNEDDPWNLKLTKLNMSANYIGPFGLKGIIKFLRNYNTACNLNELYLGGNILGDEGARILKLIISILANLNVLYVNNNEITSCGASSICDGLNKNQSLTYFDISQNSIENQGLIEIGDLVKKQPNLTFISLKSNNLDLNILSKLIEACPKRKKGRQLKIDASSNYLLEREKRKLKELAKKYIDEVIIDD